MFTMNDHFLVRIEQRSRLFRLRGTNNLSVSKFPAHTEQKGGENVRKEKIIDSRNNRPGPVDRSPRLNSLARADHTGEIEIVTSEVSAAGHGRSEVNISACQLHI